LNIEKVEHIAINVRDIERSRDFYGRILGFKPLESVDCGECVIHYFQVPDGSRMELFQYKAPQDNPPRRESDGGLRHLAFRVVDVAAHEQVLRAEGITITLPTCDLPNLSARVLLFLDPDGVTLEFCEKLPGQGDQIG
jgi:glyoxylase I family protein